MQFVELCRVFRFQDQCAGEYTVAGAVGGGIGLAFGGDGSSGFGSVRSGGGDLFGTSHGVGRVHPRIKNGGGS